ncbi:MAG: hypothetical protein HOV80_03295 [Polyangiaceae bacterium]|nr:hypothetical protein [Polyangiaceae bacterium]
MTSILRSAPFAAACFVLVGCGTETFEIQDSGRTVTLDVEEEFEVHLPLDYTHGDKWSVKTLDQRVVKSLEAQEPEVPEAPAEGEEPEAVTLVLPFQCVAAGKTHMILSESDPDGRLVGTFNLDVQCKGDGAAVEETETAEE